MTNPIQRPGASALPAIPSRPTLATVGATPATAPASSDRMQLSNPVALAAARVKAALPPGVEVKVSGDRIDLVRAGTNEPLYVARLEDGKWTHGGYRQHGLFGPPERADIMQALEAAGIAKPRPVDSPPVAPPAPPPAPSPAPALPPDRPPAEPPQATAPVAPSPMVPTPSVAGYERIGKMLAAQLPGIEVKAGPNGLTFSRDGEAFYALSVRDGQWSSGGFRQHGIRGHADSPEVRAVLKDNGYGN